MGFSEILPKDISTSQRTWRHSLIDGIKRFGMSMTPSVCRKYIGHVQKVFPKVIEELTEKPQVTNLSLCTVHCITFN